MIIFLVIILYLLGARINVNVDKVREIQEVSEPPSIPPTESLVPAPIPAPIISEPEGVLGPYGYLTDEMLNQKWSPQIPNFSDSNGWWSEEEDQDIEA